VNTAISFKLTTELTYEIVRAAIWRTIVNNVIDEHIWSDAYRVCVSACANKTILYEKFCTSAIV